MPVLNGMPWLPEAVASIRNQPGPVELIVCDGGSEDGSREWLTDHSDRDTHLIFEPDSGQSAAISRGLHGARGEIVGWLNADDRFTDDAFGVIRAALLAHPDAPLVSGGCELIDEGGAVIGRIPLPPNGSHRALLEHPTNLAQPATLFRRAAYEATGGLDPALHYAMDVDLWLKLTRLGDAVLLEADTLAQFRIHPAAKTTRAATAMIREDLQVRLRHGLPLVSTTALTLGRAAYLGPLKASVRDRLFGKRVS